MRTAEDYSECPFYKNAKCVIYTGEYLSYLGVYPGDSLKDIYKKINDAIAGGCGNTITSTTTVI